MGRTRRRIWRVAGTVLLASASLAWPAAARELVVALEDVRFQRYGVEDGLSQTSVRTMLQDEQGYVWFGTQDGLNRFDGYEFRVYRSDPHQADSLPDNHITILQRSRRGGFWVGTMAGGLGRYVPEADAFVRYQADGSPGCLATNAINTVHETADGTLWVAGSAGELQWLAPGSERFRSVSPTLAARIGAVKAIEPIGDRLLLGSATGLWLLEPDGQRAVAWTAAPAMHAVESIATAADGAIWVGTHDRGLLRFDPDGALSRRWRPADGLGSDRVTDLQFDRDGRLWIATSDGLSRLDSPASAPRTWRFGSGLAGTLASSQVHSLMLGRDGLLWAGTWLNGVSLHVPQSRAFAEIQVRPVGAGGSSVAVHALAVDHDGTLWLGVAENLGLVHYDPARGLLGHYQHRPGDPASLPGPLATDVISDRRGRVWVGTDEGLARRHGDGFVSYRHDPADPGSLPENPVHRLYEDRADTLWVGTENGYLAALCDGCTRFRNYRLRAAAGGERAEAIFEDSRGNFWIGGRTGGLYRLDRDSGPIENFRSRPGEPGRLGHDSVTAIIEDSRGRLWLGTQGGGVNRMTIGPDGALAFTSYGIHEGLATQAVGGLAEDAAGRIWISTTAGISRLDPATGRITNFDAAAGAQIMGYFVGAFGRFDDGRIAFGGMQGVTVFHPGDVRPLPSPRTVTLTDMSMLRADSHGTARPMPVRLPHNESTGLPLPPDADHISIEFSALSYAAPGLLRYAYRLEGLGDDWVEVDADHRQVSYTNLQPGSYIFRARARTPQGDWSEELVLPIRLKAAWWQSDLAQLAYVLGVLVLLAAIAWAIRQRREERELNQREVADSEQRLKLALWGTGDELWDWDIARGQVRRQNPLDRPDAHTDEVIASTDRLRDWIHPDDQAVFDRALAGHSSGPGDSMEVSYRSRNRDGQWRWRLSRGRVVARDAAGQPLRIVGTSSDITRLKENELELARINAELESRVRRRTVDLHATNESLRNTIDELRQTQQHLVDAEKLAALGGLVAGIAHEINTPLGVSVTAASYLEQEARQLEQQLEQATLEHTTPDPAALERFRVAAVESSRLILHNLRRADRMIRSFKQVAVDQSSEEPRRIDLRAYLDEIMVSLQPSLRPHQVAIDCPPGIELDTYPGAIYQVISNLVMNSLMHGFREDVPGRIRIIVQARQDDVILRYADNGVGMDAETCRRVFDPFFTTRRGDGGSGLGMHITWNLATQVLGGSIGCESAPGQGARFVLRIPWQRAPRRDAVAGPPRA